MFRFKQFVVHDESCGMKVGTDGTLLGAWAALPTPCRKMLDVGTGSGLIALMLAQRSSSAKIWAIDIDEDATAQARANFEASPWKDRLCAEHLSLQEMASEQTLHHTFDLIVSNPPYFENSLKNPDNGRKTARHTDSLSFEELIYDAKMLLSKHGQLSMVLPADAESRIRQIGTDNGLNTIRLTRVHTKARKPAKRILITFGESTTECRYDTLCLIGEDGSPRTEEYAALCRDFYL